MEIMYENAVTVAYVKITTQAHRTHFTGLQQLYTLKKSLA
jgi:hypothetical protein